MNESNEYLIPGLGTDFNLRFDLYSTLIQYIQSRGRARHMESTVCITYLGVSLVQTNVFTQFAHMVERNNLMHETAVEEVRRSEVVTVTSPSKEFAEQ